MHIAIVSDIHYSCELERQRYDFEKYGVPNPFFRFIAKLYRRFVWLKDPLNHYYKLDLFLKKVGNPDFAIALGDYTCDTAFIGIADELSLTSAKECLGKLQSNLAKTLKPLSATTNLVNKSLWRYWSLRLASYNRLLLNLGLNHTGV
jgi:hypothetical protein